MSLYSLVFGENLAGEAILATLGLTTGDVGRYRDCFVTEGKIAVYTRNGGGNRDYCWCSAWSYKEVGDAGQVDAH